MDAFLKFELEIYGEIKSFTSINVINFTQTPP